MSSVEIEKKKINATSEYSKKLHENAVSSEKIYSKSVPSKQVPMTLDSNGSSVPADSVPLGPPPPLMPTTFATSQGNLLVLLKHVLEIHMGENTSNTF